MAQAEDAEQAPDVYEDDANRGSRAESPVRSERTDAIGDEQTSPRRNADSFVPKTLRAYLRDGATMDAMRTDAKQRQLKNEIATLKNKMDYEIQLREDEITGLRKQLAEEKRDRDRLVMDHTNLEKNLADITRSFESQRQQLERRSKAAEARSAALEAEMVELNGKSAAEREALDAQLHKAKTQLEGLKLALAAAALEAGGGSGASAEDTKRDAEEAAAERQEPLPRDPTTWLNFTYTVDDQGSLVSFSRKPGSAVKPFDGDGARAVMALVKQVARLYRQRKALREDQASAGRNLNNASKVMEAMEAEHVSINSQIDAMVGTIQRVKATHKLVGVVSAPPPKPEDARLLDRLQVVGHMLDSLEAELNFRAQFAPPSGPAAGGSPQHNTNSSRRTSGSGEVVEPAGSAAGSKPGSRAGAPRSSASNVKSIYSQSLAVGGGRAPSGGRPVVKTAAGSASSTMRSR